MGNDGLYLATDYDENSFVVVKMGSAGDQKSSQIPSNLCNVIYTKQISQIKQSRDLRPGYIALAYSFSGARRAVHFILFDIVT